MNSEGVGLLCSSPAEAVKAVMVFGVLRRAGSGCERCGVRLSVVATLYCAVPSCTRRLTRRSAC
jgi:hypothetical protein